MYRAAGVRKVKNGNRIWLLIKKMNDEPNAS